MKKHLIIALLILTGTNARAQFFSKKSVVLNQGLILFNEPILNNRNNANNRASWMTEIEKIRHAGQSEWFSWQYGFGIGNYKNPDNRFEAYQSTTFYRAKVGLLLHLPFTKACDHCIHINRVNPYLNIGYNFDLLNNAFKSTGDNRANANLRLGGGVAVRLGKSFGVHYGLSFNQRVNPDYRTFFQHNIGLIVTLEEPFNDQY